MVNALLDGKKTQTRRIVSSRLHLIVDGDEDTGRVVEQSAPDFGSLATKHARCPYGAAGDRLWVKETFGPCAGGIVYRAEGGAACPDGGRWKPSIYMPRWASRITLELTSVRVQRLNDLTEDDAKAEGAEPEEVHGAWSHVEGFSQLWDGINADRAPWSSNPFVWVLEFKRLP
jgi:hypothetical protein